MRLVHSAIAIICVLASTASAEPIRLDYGATGKGCPDRGRFADEVSARVGSSPFDDSALSVVRVRIFADDDDFVGVIEAQGVKARSFRDGQCAGLVQTLASALATQLDSLAPKATSADLGPTPADGALLPLSEGVRPHWVTGSFSYSNIRRVASASGIRTAVGYDRMLGASASIGGRVGIAWHGDNFGSALLPYFGVRAFAWLKLGMDTRFKLGGGAELWLNSASETGINNEPVFLNVLAEIGPLFDLGRWAIEIPVEIGVMPYFSPGVYTIQVGVQVNRSL